MLLDLHSHRDAPYPAGIISTDIRKLPSVAGEQLYSVGFHPWNLSSSGLSENEITQLEIAAARPDVVGIGECGLDMLRPGLPPLALQMLALRIHVRISEEIGKPLILHCVKAHDILIGLRKEYQPSQPWIIHGFRGKPAILRMLVNAGIGISYGERYNPESVIATPVEKLYAETDGSLLPITEIIGNLGRINPEITAGRIASNLRDLIK